jgi:hypothetical protein
MLISLPFIASFFFVASYPYLWADPVGRTQVLFDFRREEMANQSRIWGDQAIGSRPEAIQRTWSMLEYRYSATGRILAKLHLRGLDEHGWEAGYDLPFAITGVLIFIAIALKRGFRTPHFMALLVLGGQTLIILLGINIDFNRYYLPIAFFFATGLGIGAGVAIDRGLSMLRRHSNRRVSALPRRVDLSPAD